MTQETIAYKIKYGYGALEFVVVENLEDVAKAMMAKATKNNGGSAVIKGRLISGAEIKTIEPDVHTYTGWHRSYQPSDGDDFAQIERDVPMGKLEELLKLTQERVNEVVLQRRSLESVLPELKPELLLPTNSHHNEVKKSIRNRETPKAMGLPSETPQRES